jgi:hypothetical protein
VEAAGAAGIIRNDRLGSTVGYGGQHVLPGLAEGNSHRIGCVAAGVAQGSFAVEVFEAVPDEQQAQLGGCFVRIMHSQCLTSSFTVSLPEKLGTASCFTMLCTFQHADQDEDQVSSRSHQYCCRPLSVEVVA